VVVNSLVSLLGQRNALTDAEQLMCEAYEAIRESDAVSDASRRGLASRLVALYVAMNRPDDAAVWEPRAKAPPPAGSQP
jgi:hypothetical protein